MADMNELFQQYKESGDINLRNKIEQLVLNSSNNSSLTHDLKEIVLDIFPKSSESFIMTLIHLFMKDFSLSREENEQRTKIYLNWLSYITKYGVKNDK